MKKTLLVVIGLMIVGGINTGLHVRDAHGLVAYGQAVDKARELCAIDVNLVGKSICSKVGY